MRDGRTENGKRDTERLVGMQAPAQMRGTPRTGPSSGILDSPVLSIVFTDRIRAPFAEKMPRFLSKLGGILSASSLSTSLLRFR